MTTSQTETARKHGITLAKRFGNLFVDVFHYIALFAIGLAIVWAAITTFAHMVTQGGISIEDILLLFIYLELGAMVGIYFKTQNLPVRFLIYIAITALTRMMIGDIQINHHPDESILYVAGAILLLALSVLVIRYAAHNFPARAADDDGSHGHQ